MIIELISIANLVRKPLDSSPLSSNCIQEEVKTMSKLT
jgi:hypothetical protein